MDKETSFLYVIIFCFLCLSVPGCGGKDQSLIPLHERQYKNETLAEARKLLDHGDADNVVWLRAARIESRLDMAAANTPAMMRPVRPVGITLKMKIGKIRSPLPS